MDGNVIENGRISVSFTAALLVDGRAEFVGEHQQKKCNQLQSLPFFMDFTGPAMVSKFFQAEEIDADGLKAAQFRGHLLLGKMVRAPDGFSFYAAKEQSVEGVKMYKVMDSVPSMDVWEYDEPPESRKKSLQNALVALLVANDLAA